MPKRLALILIIAAWLRLNHLASAPHFGDMDWFFNSARQALVTGRLPLEGITASITWLHQGPLWTYMLLLPTAISLPYQALTVTAGVAAVALAYFAAGSLAALVLAMLPFAVISDQTPYHTALLPLFFFVAYLSLQRHKPFWGGVFIGFLYQSHLLTFVYWPLWLYLIFRSQLRLSTAIWGFILGIVPFILAGPIQTLGIFVWLAKQLVTGLGGVSSGISTAYWQVLLPGGILALGGVLKWIHAHGRHFGQK